MSIPALKAIRRAFPQSTLHVLTVPWVQDIYTLSGVVNGIILYERNRKHKGIKGVADIASLIKTYRFSVAFVLPNSWRSALVPWLARIPVRVGLSRRCRGLFFFTDSRKPEKNFQKKHQVFYYLSIVEILKPEIKACRSEFTGTPFLSFDHNSAEIVSVASRLGLDLEKPWFAMAPGAKYGDAKLWWPERFSTVADSVAREYGAQVIMLGSRSDSKTASEIASKTKTGIVDLTGKTTLREAITLLRHSRVLLTNDSGLMHVAAAIGAPLVAIFGSTDPVHTGPYGPPEITVVLESTVDCHPCFQRKCPRGHKNCMKQIEADDVMRYIRQLWMQQ